MGERGVEPLRLAALVPKTSVSAISPLARKTACQLCTVRLTANMLSWVRNVSRIMRQSPTSPVNPLNPTGTIITTNTTRSAANNESPEAPLTADDLTHCAPDRQPLWILAVITVTMLVLLSFHSFSNMPRNDDFSYARTADAMARTGHIAYNGWGSPLMLPQAYLGALLIRLFGFSYDVLDTVGVLSTVGIAGTMFALGRQCRLSRP